MKNFGLYLVGGLMTLGLATGCAKAQGIESLFPKETEFKIARTIYHEFKKGVPTCVYDDDRDLIHGLDGTQEEGIISIGTLSNIRDRDGINIIRISSYDVNKKQYKDGVYSGKGLMLANLRISFINAPKKDVRENPTKIEIEDTLGNKKNFELTLEKALENYSPLRTKPPKKGSCEATY